MSLDTDLGLKRDYGPFRGFVDSIERHLVPLDAITGDSVEVLVDPDRGCLSRRQGTSRVGSSTGVLEMGVAAASMRGMCGWELKSPSLSDGYPTHAVLFGDEALHFGQVYVRDTDGPTDYTLGEEFSATHYPTAASTVGNLKIVPIPYDGGGATGYTRFVSEYDRRRPMAGSRARAGASDWELFPGYDAVPTVWNRRFNRSSASGSQKVRIRPAGHVPPLHMGTTPTASYPTRSTTVGPWAEGDTFFRTVLFQHWDGSYSMPCIPRDRSAAYTNGYGLTIVPDDADGTGEWFEYLPWRNLPLGDASVRRRILCRGFKKTKAQVTSGEWPKFGPEDLYVCGYVDDNTSTSYDDPNGDDGTLIEDADVISFLHRWPERARQAWAFDQRFGIGDLRANPCALIVAPTGSAASYDLNADDDSVLIHGSQGFLLRVTKSTGGTMTLELRTVAIAGVPTTTSITLASKTLEQVVDEINATVFGGAGREWRAQCVPGVNRNAPADQLAPTSQDIGNCQAANGSTTVTSTNTDAFKDVAEGHRFRGSANIPAGAYVTAVDRTTNKSLTISVATTGAIAAGTTLTAHVDVGDDALVTDSTYGNMRAYAQSWPVVLALKQAWLDLYYEADRNAFAFTAGGPTHAPYAIESWRTSVANRKEAPSDAGTFVGAAPLLDGCVLMFTKWHGILRNRRAGGTGEDADYRADYPWRSRGCIAFQSIVSGGGWVADLTQDGYWATDGEREAFLSTDVYNPAGGGRGSWANEVALCAAQSLKGGSDFGFRAHVARGMLWVAWRTTTATGVVADRLQRYNFSPTVEATGLAQVLTPDGAPYGWSAPLTYNPISFGSGARAGCLFSVQKSTGLQLLTCDDTNDGTTCGFVNRIENGTYLDGGNPVAELIFARLDDWAVDGKKAAHQARVDYALGGGANDYVTVTLFLNQLRTGGLTRRLMRTPSTVQMTEKKLEWQQEARGSATHHELMIEGEATSATRTNADYFALQLLGEACDDES